MFDKFLDFVKRNTKLLTLYGVGVLTGGLLIAGDAATGIGIIVLISVLAYLYTEEDTEPPFTGENL